MSTSGVIVRHVGSFKFAARLLSLTSMQLPVFSGIGVFYYLYKTSVWNYTIYSFSFFIPLLSTLRNHDGDGNGNVKKAIGLMSKTTTLHVITLFCTFLYYPYTTMTWNGQILRSLVKRNGKALNSSISVWTQGRSPLFSTNKDTNSIFQRCFHGRRCCRIVRSLIGKKRVPSK